MIKTTPWVEYDEDGRRYRTRARYGLDYDFARKNSQAPYFSAQQDTEILRGRRWQDESGGVLGGPQLRHFPELRPYVHWHLTSTEQPLHYLANAKYWWQMGQGKGEFKRRPYDPDPIEAFKSTIVFGAVEGDELPPLNAEWKDVEPWLAARLPILQANFERDMKKLGVWEGATA